MKTRILSTTLAGLISVSGSLLAAAAVPTADLSLWLQADTGVVLNGGTVSEWDDQSGQGHNAYQSSDASQPALVTTALGSPGLRFDGLNDFLNFTNNINELFGLTIFIVANNNSSQQTGGSGYSDSPAIFWNETASWGWTFLSPFQTNVNWRIGTTLANNNERYARPASIGDGYSVTTLLKNADAEMLYVDGSPARSVTGKGLTTFGVAEDGYLGRGYNTYFSGNILEVLVYNAALSDTDRQAVEDYLHNKYLANALPTVTITSPANFASFSAPANITIMADATDDSAVTNVEFFVNGVSIGNDTTVPYSLDWNNVPGGAYGLTVEATDDQGAKKLSDRVVVRVNYATPEEGPQLADLSLWLKADAGVTATVGKVSQWDDQSGFERHASQPVADAQPTLVTAGNGLPAVSFDGLSDYLSFLCPINGLSQLTVFVVANNTAPQAPMGSGQDCACVFWLESNESGAWGSVAVSSFQNSATWLFGTGVAQTGSPNYPGPVYTRPQSIDVQYSRMAAVKDGTTEWLYVNGENVASVTGKASNLAHIGDVGWLGRGYASDYFRGEILEVLVYTNALSGEQITNVDTYLSAKYWGKAQPTVTIDTPANHTSVTGPANLTVSATPNDTDGTIAQVEFIDNGSSVGTVTAAPWSITLNNLKPGTHVLKAKVTDNDGLFNYSVPVEVSRQAASGFALVENFEGLTPGPLAYQGDWQGSTAGT